MMKNVLTRKLILRANVNLFAPKEIRTANRPITIVAQDAELSFDAGITSFWEQCFAYKTCWSYIKNFGKN